MTFEKCYKPVVRRVPSWLNFIISPPVDKPFIRAIFGDYIGPFVDVKCIT